MKFMRFLTAALPFIVLAGAVHAETTCESPSEDNAAWMRGTLKQWQQTAVHELRLADVSLPWVIFFDAKCSWNVNASQPELDGLADHMHRGVFAYADDSLPLAAYAHGGNIGLPEGGAIPPQLILFASTFGADRKPYMVMAMPEIWRMAPQHADQPAAELDRLIRSIFVHEMTHTKQSSAFSTRLDEIVTQNGINDDEMNDDIVQHRFAGEQGFSDSVDKERNLLFDAARTADERKAKALAQEAVGMIRKRHKEWLSGANAHLAELEDIFLYMEGTANWAAYRALLDQGMTPDEALPVLRRGGRYWTQDEGLAIFLAIDRLMPGWQAVAMSDNPGSVLKLLERAAGGTAHR